MTESNKQLKHKLKNLHLENFQATNTFRNVQAKQTCIAMTAKQTSRWTNQMYVQMNTHSVNTSTTSNARTNKCLLKTNIQMKAQTNTQNE